MNNAEALNAVNGMHDLIEKSIHMNGPDRDKVRAWYGAASTFIIQAQAQLDARPESKKK